MSKQTAKPSGKRTPKPQQAKPETPAVTPEKLRADLVEWILGVESRLQRVANQLHNDSRLIEAVGGKGEADGLAYGLGETSDRLRDAAIDALRNAAPPDLPAFMVDRLAEQMGDVT